MATSPPGDWLARAVSGPGTRRRTRRPQPASASFVSARSSDFSRTGSGFMPATATDTRTVTDRANGNPAARVRRASSCGAQIYARRRPAHSPGPAADRRANCIDAFGRAGQRRRHQHFAGKSAQRDHRHERLAVRHDLDIPSDPRLVEKPLVEPQQTPLRTRRRTGARQHPAANPRLQFGRGGARRQHQPAHQPAHAPHFISRSLFRDKRLSVSVLP